MNKAEKIVIVIGLGSLLIGFLAWQFPAGNNGGNIRMEAIDSASKSIEQRPKIGHDEESPASEQIEVQNIEKANQAQPLVSQISFDLFLSQIKSFSLDSQQLNYARKTKEKLGGKIEFVELNLLVDEMSLDSNRIAMIKIFRDIVNSPTEKELEVLTNKFWLSSNRQAALDLLY